MIDFTEIPDGDNWELFARTFLQDEGFFIESPPNRGADGGVDMIVTEQLTGKVGNYKLRWLVSCKHYAGSRKAVNENDDEKNLSTRIKKKQCDGFIGFYSTLPTNALKSTLDELRSTNEIKDYKIYDGKYIENRLITSTYGSVFQQFFPESYKKLKPLTLLYGKYIPLKCDNCGLDLLQSYENHRKINGLMAEVSIYDNQSHEETVHNIYFACKGECDEKLKHAFQVQGYSSSAWHDIFHLTNPYEFMDYILASFIRVSNDQAKYSPEALKRYVYLLKSLSQIVMKPPTNHDKERKRTLDEVGLSF